MSEQNPKPDGQEQGAGPDLQKIAHDLNNELNVIGGYLELLATKPFAQGVILEHIQEMRDAFQRARSLVRQIRSASPEGPA